MTPTKLRRPSLPLFIQTIIQRVKGKTKFFSSAMIHNMNQRCFIRLNTEAIFFLHIKQNDLMIYSKKTFRRSQKQRVSPIPEPPVNEGLNSLITQEHDPLRQISASPPGIETKMIHVRSETLNTSDHVRDRSVLKQNKKISILSFSISAGDFDC